MAPNSTAVRATERIPKQKTAKKNNYTVKLHILNLLTTTKHKVNSKKIAFGRNLDLI